MVGVSSWKKGHYASNVPLPRSRTHMDKGQKQSDLLIIFFIRKRACHICTPLCPLFRKSRYSAYHGCSKNYFVSFLLYIDLVFCFFAPEKQYSGILLKLLKCVYVAYMHTFMHEGYLD